ncbi:MAG: hypothetical protein AAFR66_15370, partial [Bacteroidota bacterium]
MDINQFLIWLVILLSAIFLLALLSLPGKNYGQRFLMLLVLNFVLHFLNIYFSEFSQQAIPISLNPFFASNYGPLLWLYFAQFKEENAIPLPKALPYFLHSVGFLLWGMISDLSFKSVVVVTSLILMINFGFLTKTISHYFQKEADYILVEKKWLLSLLGLFGTLLVVVSLNLFFAVTEVSSFHDK